MSKYTAEQVRDWLQRVFEMSIKYDAGNGIHHKNMADAIDAILRERESAKADYSHVAADLLACDWQEGDLFYVNDDPDEHKPCYLVMPDGACLVLNHHATNGVDQARAQFIADCCNQVLCPIQAPNEAVAPMLASARVPDGWQLVPVEATDEMCEAAWESDASDYVGEHRRIHRADLAYKAMLAAAPKPETEE